MNKARISKHKRQADSTGNTSPYHIAIIGIACKFPQADDYNKFWENLKEGVDSITEIPKNRWDIDKYYSPDPREQNKTLSKWGGLISNERDFDNRFFNISPREAKNMDPQQRILLEETWHCIEDSGIPLSHLRKNTTSCYVGVMASDYYQEAWSPDIIVDSYAGLGNYDCILANRLSYFFGFTGVSMAVDAACASSLVAIHEARGSLIMGESDYAIAAGVNLTTQPWKYISFSKSRMLSPDGECKTFDKDANGYVPGEGVGVILLQRLEDAQRDHNHIYGVIIGTAVNHGGMTESITAPKVKAQQDVITSALKNAAISPFTINYMEAHGTGTSLGDPVEVESLTKAYREYLPYEISEKVYNEEILAPCPDDNKEFVKSLFEVNNQRKTVCLKDSLPSKKMAKLRGILQKIGFIDTKRNQIFTIGSVKTNIGHLEAAAGVAGVIKILMMMKYKKIALSLNVKDLNPIINFPKTPFKVGLKFEFLFSFNVKYQSSLDNAVIVKEIRDLFENKCCHLSGNAVITVAKPGTAWFITDKNKQYKVRKYGDGLDVYRKVMKNPDWLPAKEGLPLRAGVSSFGFGGVNSHAILEEYKEESLPVELSKTTKSGENGTKYFVLSAKSEYSMKELIARWQAYSAAMEFENEPLDNICKTLLIGRDGLLLRAGTPVKSKEDIVNFLKNEKFRIVRNTNEQWCLRIGQIQWGGAAHCDYLFKDGSLFKDKLKSVIESCFDKEEQDLVHSEIKNTPWSMEMKDLFLLLTGYVFLLVLKNCGMKYDVVSGEGNGFILALVMSGMVSIQDAVQIVRKRRNWSRIKLNRPEIPFYDHINDKTIMPFDFDDAYLALMILEMGRKNKLFGQILVDGILYTKKAKGDVDEEKHRQDTQLGNILLGMGAINREQLDTALQIKYESKDLLGHILVTNKYCKPKDLREALQQQDILRHFVNDVLNHYVKAAKKLFQPGQSTGQKTFENYLEEWNVILKKHGHNIEELLFDEHLFSANKGRISREKLLLMIILVNSFRRLNKKWNLSEEMLFGEKRFCEIVDLVDDGVIPKEALVDLLLNDDPKYKEIAQTMNARQNSMRKSKEYFYIKQQNPNIREITNVGDWVKKSMTAENTVPSGPIAYKPLTMYTFIQFSRLSTSMKDKDVIDMDTALPLKDVFYQGILDLWLNGLAIDWERLVDEKSFVKAILPQYPFDRQPFWLERSMELGKVNKEESTDRYRASKLKKLDQYGRQYKRSFSLSDSIVRDHIITEKYLIPGAEFIEMGLEAAQRGTRKELKILKEVFIYNPAPVDKSLDTFVDINLHESQFIIRTGTQQICTGQYDASPLAPAPSLDLSRYMSSEPFLRESLYQSLADAGYQYGLNLQVINRIWSTDNTFLFELNEFSREEGLVTHLSSHLLDGVFQTALAVINTKHFFDSRIMYVPYYMKTIRLYGSLTDSCYVCVHEEDIKHKDDDMFVRFSVYDSAGKMICEILDMVYKRVNKDFLAPGIHGFAGQVHTYCPVWKTQEIHREIRDVSTRLAVVFADSRGQYKTLAEELKEHYSIVILVLPGSEYRKGITYCINPDNEEHYKEVFTDLAKEYEHRYIGCDIFHMWCYGPEDQCVRELDDIYQMNRLGLKSLFSLARALVSEKVKGHVNLFICSNNVFAVRKDDTANRFFHGSIPGFAMTLMLESTKFTIRMLDFGTDGFSDQERAKVIYNEVLSLYQDTMTAYRDKTRYVQAMVPEEFHDVQLSPAWKDGGVYILVGGAGGIGMKLVQHVLGKANAALILVGRGNLTPEKQNKIDKLQLSGKEVQYVKGDVTNLDDMKRIIREAKGKYGTIRGVVHSGGVLDDRMFMNKTWDSFCNVLSPKVLGIWNLHEATKEEPLDFFMAFSSIVSILGNTGQSDYAAANAFLDAFIHYRAKAKSHGKSISVNWTLWSDGGMGNSPEILESFFRKSGIIDSKQAMKALNNILNSDSIQCVVAGKALMLPRVAQNVPLTAQTKGKTPVIQGPDKASLVKVREKARIKVSTTLVALLSEIIGVPASDLDISTDLREYGMDSVGFGDYAERINENLTTAINPTAFFEYPTMKELTDYLLENYAFDEECNCVKAAPEKKIEAPAGTKTPVKKNIQNVQDVQNVRDVRNTLLTILSGIVGAAASDLDAGADVREYGVDSVGFTEYAEKINEQLKTNVNPTLFFEYPTIDGLNDYLLENYPDLAGGTEIPELANDTQQVVPEKTDVSGILLEILSKIIDTKAAELDAGADVREYGVDSVGFTEFAEKINDTLKTNVNPTMFFEYPSISAMNDYLVENYPGLSSGTKGITESSSNTMQNVKIVPEVKIEPEEEEPEGEELKKITMPINKAPKNLFHTRPGYKESSNKEEKDYCQAETIRTGPQKSIQTDIAVVGMSGRFPGADNLFEFWNRLGQKKDCITEIPGDRWDWRQYWGDPKGNENKINSRWGGFLKDIRRFDAKFFKISPREAELMDPQQRILIEEVWHTLEDAGYRPSSLSETNTGIFIGVCNDDYNDLLIQHNVRMDAYSSTGSYFSILPNRISYLLNIHGPSVAIDTACSSSLVAIHQAVQSILYGDCELALAGGVNICCTPRRYISFCHAGMLSKTGKCMSFNRNADGYVRGEGVGVILLKPLDKAIKDGNYIYGVIKGTAVNHGGFSTSLTAPNTNAQAHLLIDAYKKAHIDPSTVSYIEAQGTGTSLGDPIEINGLKKAFTELYKLWGKVQPNKAHCGISTAKSHIGHLESAAGITGVIKALLSMKYRKLTGILNLHDEQHPYIQLDGTPFYFVEKTTDWEHLKDEKNKPIPRRAGVSAFGFGGANAHVVLEEYIPAQKPVNLVPGKEYVFSLSAKSPEQLFDYAKQLYDFLEIEPGVSPADMAYTLHTGREVYENRLAVIAASAAELKEYLKIYITGKVDGNRVFTGEQGASGAQLSLVTKGKSGELFLATIVENKELDKLAQLWASGLDFDFNVLYKNESYNLIPLPVYPFAHDRYWIREGEETSLELRIASKQKLHLLVDCNKSTLQEEKFTTLLKGTEFFLADHRIGERKMLPGVAYIEMARAAGELAGERKVERIQNVVWMRPVFLNGKPKEISISFYPGDTAVDFEVSSQDSEDERILHSQGKIVYRGSESNLLEPGTIDITSLKSRCDEERSDSDCYTLFEQAGYKYGLGFRSLKRLYYNENEAVSEIELPKHISNTLDEFYLHPSLMDASIQTILGLIQKERGEKVLPFLPFSLDEVVIFSSLPGSCVAYVKTKKEIAQNVKIFDIVIADHSGKILLTMNNFTLKRYSPGNGHGQIKTAFEGNKILSDKQILELLNKLKEGTLSTEDAEKIIEDSVL